MKTNIWNKISLTACISGMAFMACADDANNMNGMDNSSNNMHMTMSQRMLDTLTAQEFVTDAAMGGMKEVRLSELAMENSRNAEIKAFAHRMITDHSKANDKLMALAQQKGLELPATNTFAADDPNWNNPMITGSEQIKSGYLLKTNPALAAYQDFKQLKTLSGKDFDQAYARDMVMDHANVVIEFEAASRIIPDADIKSFATTTLPTLRMHQKMARKLLEQVSGNQTAQTDVSPGMNPGNTTAAAQQ